MSDRHQPRPREHRTRPPRPQSEVVTNDTTTGRTGACRYCRLDVEEGLLLRGAMRWDGEAWVPSSGTPVWRTLDRGHECAVCGLSPSGLHDPAEVTP